MRKLTKYALLILLTLLLMGNAAFASGNVTVDLVPLGDVNDPITAVGAVEAQIISLGEISSVDEISFVADYADAAISRAAVAEIKGDEIDINLQEIADTPRGENGESLEALALRARRNVEKAVENELAKQGEEAYQEIYRKLLSTVIFTNEGDGIITVVIDPDICDVSVDIIQVKTPLYSLSFSPVDLGQELTETLVITMEDISETGNPVIRVTMSNETLANSLTLSLPDQSGELSKLAIMDNNGHAHTTRHNNITSQMEGMINSPGVYGVGANGTEFEDLKGLSSDVLEAIQAFATQEITTGTTPTTFSPDASVNRGQFVTFLMRCLGRTSWTGNDKFSDIKGTYYRECANAAADRGYISGYQDNTFKGGNPLYKQHICKILGLVLQEKGYTVPVNRQRYLGNYDDEVIEYAQNSVAILRRLGILPAEKHFNGTHVMSRAEVADLLYKALLK